MGESGWDLAAQARLAQTLGEAGRLASGPVQVIETHISWVFLTGEHAYKLKKALDLGFLDYSTLERRRFCGEEELRLNRRTAPDLYLDLIPVGGTPDAPRVGQEPAGDYLVRMRRFPEGALLSERLASGRLTVGELDDLALALARFHLTLPRTGENSPLGTPEMVHLPVRQNFIQVAERLPLPARRLVPLREWAENAFIALTPLMSDRHRDGFVRECHGDLHLGNIALVDGRPQPFDGIEFSESLRWIDVMSEVAFLTMDLEDRGRPDLAARVLNRYLEQTGDYAGLALLRYYQAYRAMVRAKVAAIRLSQPGLDGTAQQQLTAEFESYARLAARFTHPGRPALLLTRGPSGSGKTTFTGPLIEALGAVRVRSDVERKRLFDLAPEACTGAAVQGGIYTPEATAATYGRLLAVAEKVLAAGLPAIVDATFPTPDQRTPFRLLAERLRVPFILLDFELPPALLRERVASRQARGGDASEADLRVLDAQLGRWTALADGERANALSIGPATRPEGLLAEIRSRMGAAT